jgi:polyphosphate glucokinase
VWLLLFSVRMTRSSRYTLSIDVGGSHIKGALLGKSGDMVSERHKEDTPSPLTPAALLRVIERMAKESPPFDRAAIGIPGVVHGDVVYSLPASGRRSFKNYPLGKILAKRLGVPVRVTNDATMHGLVMITLGTGLGTALFIDGTLSAHYQTLPDADEVGSPYGNAALEEIGRRRWRQRIRALVEQLRVITNYDRLYVGGGNAKEIGSGYPRYVTRVDNIAGILGGHQLWEWGDVP